MTVTYRTSSDGWSRTDSYRFSVTDKNDPAVIALKKDIAIHNANIRKRVRERGEMRSYDSLKRVSFMARGPRRSAPGKVLHSNADSNLQHKYAKHFDVYVHSDGPNECVLQQELKTGLTPGMQRKVGEVKNAIWSLERDLDSYLRDEGISVTYSGGEKAYIATTHLRRHAIENGMRPDTAARIFGAE